MLMVNLIAKFNLKYFIGVVGMSILYQINFLKVFTDTENHCHDKSARVFSYVLLRSFLIITALLEN